jgi:hypothetical protein
MMAPAMATSIVVCARVLFMTAVLSSYAAVRAHDNSALTQWDG